MKNTKLWRSILAMMLSVCMLISYLPQVNAAPMTGDISFEQVDDSTVTASLLEPVEKMPTEDETVSYEANETVRVVILLEGNSAIEQGYSTASIGESRAAQNYRQMVMQQQAYTTRQIEAATGEILDVQWNLTILANAISANVEYGQIEQIKQVSGVADVQIELQFAPPEVSVEETAQPNMILSGGMTNINQSWESGYTGAGTRVAIIDTGLDTDHQSVAEMGLQYAYNTNARKAGVSIDDYMASLNLLNVDEITEKLSQLNAYASGGTSSSKLYLNGKVPFGFNYIDRSYDITHDNDSAGNHGSHVAGIVAANRFIFPNNTSAPVNALNSVYVTGNAPDAQLLIMKVFGAAGGAYETDIYAAIEDAIVLEADTVNLSLGSVIPGGSDVGFFQDIMESLKNSATTVVVSAGNNSDWVNSSQNSSYLGGGHLYADDVSMNTIGTPASGTNSLAVASVQNDGMVTSGSLMLEGKLIDYNANHTAPSGMKGFASLDTSSDGTGTTYEYVMVESYGAEGDFDDIDVEGKIVLVSRGMTINFADKANRAVAAGAAATIIYNNVDGTINMNLEGYTYTDPCISITLQEAQKFKTAGTTQTAPDGSTYYTGQVSVRAGRTVVESDSSYYTMSDFSSWGTTGDLALKPEITAPGGNIYSINGGGTATDRYVGMSGTSMAAPQVSGIGALVSEYIEDQGYVGVFANPDRGLTQSLLMSTAVPLVDSEGQYYPLIQQGAGLVNAGAATSADSYIKMCSDATVSYDDGKVKAELGDDPGRTGVYSFGFEIHNLDGAEHTYDLSADVFAQDHFEAQTTADGTYTTEYMSESTTALDAVTVFTVNGQPVEHVTVPANGKMIVQTTITLTDTAKQEYLETYFAKGTYVQAYIFADAQADAEGVDGTTHSIPMLAFYGNWTDSSMFWGGSTAEGQQICNYSNDKTSDYSRANYFLFEYQWEDGGPWYVYQPDNYFSVTTANGLTHVLGGNPLVADDTYMPERNAISSGLRLESSVFNLVRNTSQYMLSITNLDTEKVYYTHQEDYDFVGAFLNQYSNNYGMDERYYRGNQTLNDLVEDETIEFAVTYLPEYYDEGKMGYGQEPGGGATASVTVVVDNSLPVATDIALDTENQTLQVTASDNQYVAAVVLYNAAGDEIISYAGAKQDIDPGQEAMFDLNYSGAKSQQYMVQVFDYALNHATYRITIKNDELLYTGAMVVFNQNDQAWMLGGEAAKSLQTLVTSDVVYNAATSIGEQVFAVTDTDELHVLTAPEFDSAIYVDTLKHHMMDLAFNPVDGYLYGVSEENKLIKIDPVNGTCTVIGDIPFATNTLACDGEGNFYSNRYGTGEVYTYTLETVITRASAEYDFNCDHVVDLADSQLLLDYVTGKAKAIENSQAADFDTDGDIDTYDVYLLQQAIPHMPRLLAVAYTTESRYLQAMEIDQNSDMLYWASYFTDLMQGNDVAFSFLWSIDPKTGDIQRHNDYWDQLSCLVILDQQTSSRIPVVEEITRLNISMKDKKLAVGEKTTLRAGVSPWNVEDSTILWSSTDESVATVDEAGNITAVGVGSCQIVAVSAADKTVSASCDVTVSQNPVPEDAERPVSEPASVAAVTNSTKTDVVTQPATLTLHLAAAEELTNGLQTVSLDTSGLTLMSINGADLLSFQCTENLLTIGYVHKEPVAAGKTAVSLTFRIDSCGDDRIVILRELERNNEHVQNRSILELEAHVWGDWVTIHTPDCDTEGAEERVCDVCDKTEERTIAAGGHTWSDWNQTQAATCLEDGLETRSCKVCGHSEEQAIPAAGFHSWSDWTQTQAATCLEDGLETRSCKACGQSEEQAIPAAGSHSWSDWTQIQAATCLEDGLKTRSCKACGQSEEEIIPAAGSHSWSGWGQTQAATCLEDGLETRSCKACGKLEEQIVPAAGSHSWSDWSQTQAATCLEDGLKTRSCKACSQSEEQTIPAVGSHSWGEWRITTQPTETEEGIKTRICSVCRSSEEEAIPATGHICPSEAYRDLDTTRWYHKGVDFMLANGYMVGISKDKFEPDGTLTRGQLVTILYRIAGAPDSDVSNPFTDVPANRYYSEAVLWAYENGIVYGTSTTTFEPDAPITREQIAAIMFRYDKANAASENYLSSFPDSGQVSKFAREAMNWAVGEGLINGTTADGTVILSPKSNATRAQIASILMRYLGV